MNTKKLKIIAIVIGIISFLYSAYSIVEAMSLVRTFGSFDFNFIFSDTTFTVLFLSPLSTIGLFVAAFGLYREKKWGHVWSNASIAIFLCGFLFILTNHFFPNLLDSEVQLDSGWFVFYHMDLNLETVFAPIVAASLCIVLNLKSTRRLLYK